MAGSYLSAKNFNGTYVPLPLASRFGLQSTYSGDVGLTLVNRNMLALMLPSKLALATPKAAQTQHPIMHMIGRQTEASSFLKSSTLYLGEGYTELIFIVPFVVRKGQNLFHNYVLRMYLDNEVAILGGDSLYGYRKEAGMFADVDSGTNLDWSVASYSDGDLAFWSRSVEASPPSDIGARWAALCTILQMPLIGTWELTDSQAINEIATELNYMPGDLITSYWEFSPPTLPGLSLDFSSLTYASFPNGNLGSTGPLSAGLAFRLDRIRWRLALPPHPGKDS